MKVLVLLCLVGMVLAGPLSQHLMSIKRTDSLTEQQQHNSSFIVNGRPALVGEIPYQVAIFPGGYSCGGSIINERWILTAAHCTEGLNPSQFTIRYGSLNYNSGGVIAKVSDIVVHVDYDEVTKDNDIALLRTSQRLMLRPNIAEAISLSYSSNINTNTLVQVSGWGLLQENNPTMPDALQIVTLLTVDQNSCRSYYPSLTDNMLCAYLSGKDACQGDSGGPLVDVSSRKLIGVVSFGNGCARPGIPGVYTRVPNYILWIKYNTQI